MEPDGIDEERRVPVDGPPILGLGDKEVWGQVPFDMDGVALMENIDRDEPGPGPKTKRKRQRAPAEATGKIETEDIPPESRKMIAQSESVVIAFRSPESVGTKSFSLRFEVLDRDDPSVVRESKLVRFPMSEVEVFERDDGDFEVRVPFAFARRHGLNQPFRKCVS